MYADKDGNQVPNTPEARATISFAESEGKTTLTWEIEYSQEAELQAVLETNMIESFNQILDSLDRYLKITN
ncbi:hypothetical protein D3C80_1933050 [compost metagenome]